MCLLDPGGLAHVLCYVELEIFQYITASETLPKLITQNSTTF